MLEKEFYAAIYHDNAIHTLKDTGHIYFNNIIQGRMNALLDIFPAVTACLSQEYMQHIAPDFCKYNDAPRGNLNLYGQKFGQYLTTLPACYQFQYIQDLADFEYITQSLLYAVDENHLLDTQFTQALGNHQSVKMAQSNIGFSSEFPILQIADFCLGRTHEMPDINTVDTLYHYFLYRDPEQLKVFVKPISSAQLEIIPFLKSKSIDNLDNALMQNPKIANFIQFLISRNIFVV